MCSKRSLSIFHLIISNFNSFIILLLKIKSCTRLVHCRIQLLDQIIPLHFPGDISPILMTDRQYYMVQAWFLSINLRLFLRLSIPQTIQTPLTQVPRYLTNIRNIIHKILCNTHPRRIIDLCSNRVMCQPP